MSWSLFRWTWCLEEPFHVGLPPAGNLDRCRLYLPSRNVWAALTEELARRKMGELPENLDRYREIGLELQRGCRFSYLYPSEQTSKQPSEQSRPEWKAWLPRFEGEGLNWRRETDSKVLPNRSFRNRLLDSRPGTAIDPATDSAAEGSLHETEVVHPWWRDSLNEEAKPVAITGYLFCKDPNIYQSLCEIDLLFVGGDTRYGLGKIARVELGKAERFFSYNVRLDCDNPEVFGDVILAHSNANAKNDLISGSLERLGGWDAGKPNPLKDTVFWAPGSKLVSNKWHKILDDGTWEALPNADQTSS